MADGGSIQIAGVSGTRRAGPRPIGPQHGPQLAFASSTADIAIYGGAAGSGKSFCILYDPVRWVLVPGVRKFRGVIFRRSLPQLTMAGGLWDGAKTMYPAFGGSPRESPKLDFRFPAKSGQKKDEHRIEFRQLWHEQDVLAYQGAELDYVGFDELTHFDENQFWYLLSRLRSFSGIRPYLRATCNPDPDSFVFELVKWWIGPDGYPIPERSGVIRWLLRLDDTIHWYDSREEALAAHPGEDPKSFTFVAGRLSDNKALTEQDPGYRGRLKLLGRVDRLRLLGEDTGGEDRGGNWLVRHSSGLFFRRADFRLATEAPSEVVRTIRAWDKAATKPTAKHPDPDWTRGVRIHLCADGELWIDDMVSIQGTPNEVFALMRQTATSDGVEVTQCVWQDSAGAGVTDLETTRNALAGFVVESIQSHAAETTGIAKPSSGASRAKRAFAKAWTGLVEAGQVYLLRAPWASEVTSEADKFPDARHDDIVDAISLGVQVLFRGGALFWSGVEAGAAKVRGEAAA
jgi:phage terminase large subunit-like protein